METRRIAFLFAVIISLALGVNARQSSRKVINFDVTEKELSLVAGVPLTVNTSKFGPNGVLCIYRTEKSQSLKMKAFAVVYNENAKAMIEWQRIEKVLPLPEAAATFQSNTLTVQGNPSRVERTVVWLSVPADTQLIVSTDGSFVDTASVGKNVMIQNGRVVDQPPGYTLQAAVMQAITFKPHQR